ncbi:caspase domain-containing protein [Aspergillus karnatakaensis]|uniref:caspase family protein n=1 Tax=Aspergillus karnatakaensis TaxID=1810916 RepID=UPI003CCCF4E5
MAAIKRALIIASPFQGLLGPLADAEAMKKVLLKQGFNIIECCNSSATRRGILDAWQSLIDATAAGDVVVIYYSGHGDLIRPSEEDAGDDDFSINEEQQRRSPFQVLVPMDYDQTTDSDFRGIVNWEISYMLRETTNKSRNVTVIIDCCHSGRLFRDASKPTVGVFEARARALPQPRHHAIANFISRLRREGHFDGELDITGNQHAVRIAASTAHESAMEYANARGLWRGAMTEALVAAMELLTPHDTDTDPDRAVSWRTILLHVQRLVQARFPQQHPRAEGPANRVPFSLRHVVSGALKYVTVVNGTPVLSAGTVVGVRVGDVYSLFPLDAEEFAVKSGSDSHQQRQPEATVVAVTAFTARLELSFWPSWASFQGHSAFAVLRRQKIDTWPVAVEGGLSGLREAVGQSKYLRLHSDSDGGCLATFQRDSDDTVRLFNRDGVSIASQRVHSMDDAHGDALSEIVKVAERLARAQRVIQLQRPFPKETLYHGVTIELGTAKNGNPDRVFAATATDITFTEGEPIYIKLENNGPDRVYISIFAIDGIGRVWSMTESNPSGYELHPQETEIIGADPFDYITGMQMQWPEGVEMTDRPLVEHYLVVLASAPVELGDLVDSVNYDLEEASRAPPPPAPKPVKIRYDVRHISYTVYPMASGKTAVPPSDVETKGFVGALIRFNKPCCVWVINEHDEEITVVVSKYAPNRILTGVGLNASPVGGGFDITSTTFSGPATKKTLAARGEGPGASQGVFPLWTRKEGFGLITIFRGPEQILFSENDRVPLGATAYFRNLPDLHIVEYGHRLL